MITEYKTKINKNGWNYKLRIDTDKKVCEFCIHGISGYFTDAIVTTKKQIDSLMEDCRNNGYTVLKMG